MRIPKKDKELEMVHLLVKCTVPQTNVFGIYLDVEQRSSSEDITRIWHKLTGKAETGESPSFCLGTSIDPYRL